MDGTTFEIFKTQALEQGFDEVVARQWAPDSVVEAHSHPFTVEARVVAGEMWLTVGERCQHLRAGDRFDLERDIVHSERYGPAGATYWVARRNARAGADAA